MNTQPFVKQLDTLRDDIAKVLEDSYVQSGRQIKYHIYKFVENQKPHLVTEDEKAKIGQIVQEAFIKFNMRIEKKLAPDLYGLTKVPEDEQK